MGARGTDGGSRGTDGGSRGADGGSPGAPTSSNPGQGTDGNPQTGSVTPSKSEMIKLSIEMVPGWHSAIVASSNSKTPRSKYPGPRVSAGSRDAHDKTCC